MAELHVEVADQYQGNDLLALLDVRMDSTARLVMAQLQK